MAIGASFGQAMQVVVGRAVQLLSIRNAGGMALALEGGRFFSQILYAVKLDRPMMDALALGLMTPIAFMAGRFRARSAMAFDPVTALRME